MRGNLFALAASCFLSATFTSVSNAPAAEAGQPAAKPLALLVTRGDYFLERAVRNLKSVRCEVVTPAQYEAAGPSQASVVIFDDYQPKRLPPTARIVLFGAVPAGIDLNKVKDGKSAHVAKVQVKEWMHNDALLKNIDLKKLFVADALELKELKGWDVLVTGDKSPLIVRGEIDHRSVVVVGFDVLESNWPLQVGFAQFLRRVASAPVAG